MRKTLIPALILLLAAATSADAQSRKKVKPRAFKMGMTQFPYDLTPEAMQETQKFVFHHSDMIAVKKDEAIPWAQALTDTPFPGELEKKWENERAGIPEGYSVLLLLTPVKGDEGHLAPPMDLKGYPDEIRNKPLNDTNVVRAYANYCRRAVKIWKPDFLCIAVEATKFVNKRPKDWPAYAQMLAAVKKKVKAENPRLPIGVSHNLAMLWHQQIARQVKPTLRDLDFLGLSFHPNLGIISELTSGRPLPRGRNQWLTPLKFARGFAGRTPIGIVDTGYSSRNNTVPALNLDVKGDPKTQQLYLNDVLASAERDRYAFVVWSMGIDCDAIADKAPPGLADFIMFIKNNGLVDQKGNAKPSLETWMTHLDRNQAPGEAKKEKKKE